ncbi:GNAT family N-acetyltransferase [Demequina flava]|uniref:GNAT family N-acetyltransferase n=1 Tax=Demequina flava TaxID=1095025 RepID=UPI000780E2F9|nr:GNAT family N-acetyltransferase [Demequina flava]
MLIAIDDLTRPEVHALLTAHLDAMHSTSPADSVHALPIESLRETNVTVRTAWKGPTLLGIGALKELDPTHGEIKSMKTATEALGKGVATAILNELLATAVARGYAAVSLETGTDTNFYPAHRLYSRHGFLDCEPFAGYSVDPHSRFMTLSLDAD